MSETPESEQQFYRIKRLPPYVFAEVNAMKAAARAAGEDIIDFGMGNPDHPSPPHVVAKLIEAVQDPKTHRYFQLARHSRAEARDRGLLRAPLRGNARPRPRGDRHPRLQGRLRQFGDGYHQPPATW